MTVAKAHSHVNDDTVKNEIQLRLKRIEGQVRGITGMVQNNAYCQDILNQIASARSALNGLQQVVLYEHVQNCIADKMLKNKKAATDELLAILKKII